MKQKKQLRQDALVRREKNIADYKAGNLGTLNIPVDTDKAEYLKGKLLLAEREVEVLKERLLKS